MFIMSKTDFLTSISTFTSPLLFNKFSKCLVSTYNAPSTIVGAVNKTDKNSCPCSADIPVGETEMAWGAGGGVQGGLQKGSSTIYKC